MGSHGLWIQFLQRLVIQTTFDSPPLRYPSLFTSAKSSQCHSPLILVCSQQTWQAVIILGNQLKKKIPGLSHQLQNPTSTETRYYCRFSVSYDSKNNNVFLFSEAFIVKQRNLRGTVLIFTKTTESYISLTGINLFYFTSKEGLTLNGNNYLHINDKFTLFYSVCKMC